MPILRKSGARSPWQPAPLLDANTDPLRQTIVVGMVMPLLVVGAQAGWIGQRPLPENTDPLRPVVCIQGQMPIPPAQLWKPEAARDPSVDPLRPLISVQDAPDATLALPSAQLVSQHPLPENTDPRRPPLVSVGQQPIADARAQWASRPAITEDTAWPARPLLPIAPPPPVPGAITAATFAPRETPGTQPDRVAQEQAQVSIGAQPIPGALAAPVGRITSTPTERTLPTPTIVGQQPIAGAQALVSSAPRDVYERLALTQAQTGQQPTPNAIPATVGFVHATPTDRLPLATLPAIRPAEPAPRANAQSVGFVHDTPLLRLAPAWVVNPPFAPPAAAAIVVGIAHEVSFVPFTLSAPARDDTLTAPARAALLHAPSRAATLTAEDR